MNRQLMAIFICAVVLAAIAVGCGSSSGSSGSTAGGESSAALTKEEFNDRATALCVKERAKVTKALFVYEQKPEKSGEDPRVRAGTAVSTILIPGIRQEVERLGEMRPPAGDEAKVGAILKTFEAAVREGEEDPLSVTILGGGWTTGNKAMKMAKAYGFEQCGAY